MGSGIIFLLGLKNLSEVELKDNGLICLVERGVWGGLKVRAQWVQTTEQLWVFPGWVPLKRSLSLCTGAVRKCLEDKISPIKGSNYEDIIMWKEAVWTENATERTPCSLKATAKTVFPQGVSTQKLIELWLKGPWSLPSWQEMLTVLSRWYWF